MQVDDTPSVPGVVVDREHLVTDGQRVDRRDVQRRKQDLAVLDLDLLAGDGDARRDMPAAEVPDQLTGRGEEPRLVRARERGQPGRVEQVG